MQPMDEEAQRAIREALAAGDIPEQGAPPPSFSDGGSYMAPEEISAENDQAELSALQATPELSDMPPPQMGGQSQVTLAQREVAQRPSSGGFDIARGLWAAGGGDLASFDAPRNREQDRQDRQVAAFDQKQLVRQGMDPQSEISRQRQGEYAQQMQSRAQIAAQSGMGELARTFADEAKRASTMSATQIDRASQTFGGVLKESMGAAEMAAKQQLAQQGQDYKQDMLQATIGNQGQQRAVDWANLGLKQDENQLRHAERADALEAKKAAAAEVAGGKLPPGNQTDEHIDATETIKLLRRAKELLPKVSYIGTGAKTVNTVLGGLPDALDVRTPEDKEFASIVQRIAAPERHKLFGSALSKGEDIVSQELLPGISKNKPTLKQVLDMMETNVTNRVKKASTLYPGLKKLESLDASQLSDQDQQALEWANAHPDDERAAKIRQKLGVK